ncbi:MAG: hypothetical protein AAB964_02885, partial [Patescibacteria group bacterium]
MPYVPVAQRQGKQTNPAISPIKLDIPSPFQSVVPQSTPAVLLPPRLPEANFQSITGENQYRPLPDVRPFAMAVKQSNPQFIPNTSISAGEPTATEKTITKLPAWLQSPVRSIVMDIQTGLFGDTRQQEAVKQLEDIGKPA